MHRPGLHRPGLRRPSGIAARQKEKRRKTLAQRGKICYNRYAGGDRDESQGKTDGSVEDPESDLFCRQSAVDRLRQCGGGCGRRRTGGLFRPYFVLEPFGFLSLRLFNFADGVALSPFSDLRVFRRERPGIFLFLFVSSGCPRRPKKCFCRPYRTAFFCFDRISSGR